MLKRPNMPLAEIAGPEAPEEHFEPWPGVPVSPPRVVARTQVRILDLRESDPRDPVRLSRIFRDVPVKDDLGWIAKDVAFKRDHVIADGKSVPITTYWKGTARRDPEPPPQWTPRDQKISQLYSGTSAWIQAPGSGVNYYHWMLEVMPRLELLLPAVRAGQVDRIVFAGEEMSFKRASLEMLFPELTDKVAWLGRPVARFEKLVCFQNHRGETRMTHATLAMISRLRKAVSEAPTRRAIVERGGVVRRQLKGADSLRADLGALGFESITGSDFSVVQQREIFSQMRVSVGVHGAGLTNIMFCMPGSKLVEVTSTQYVNRVTFSDLAIASGLEAHVVLVDEVGGKAKVVNNLGNDLTFSPTSYSKFVEYIKGVVAS